METGRRRAGKNSPGGGAGPRRPGGEPRGGRAGPCLEAAAGPRGHGASSWAHGGRWGPAGRCPELARAARCCGGPSFCTPNPWPCPRPGPARCPARGASPDARCSPGLAQAVPTSPLCPQPARPPRWPESACARARAAGEAREPTHTRRGEPQKTPPPCLPRLPAPSSPPRHREGSLELGGSRPPRPPLLEPRCSERGRAGARGRGAASPKK